jgi:integrase
MNPRRRIVASSHIIRTTTSGGATRYRVRFRLGGREAPQQHGGSFKTQREAIVRQRWIDDQLAAGEVPDLARLEVAHAPTRTIMDAAEAWRRSRVDVSPGTAQTYLVAINRLRTRIGARAIDSIGPQTVADLVAELTEADLRKQTIRKTVSVLAMILDHEGVQPNPARDKQMVKLPREAKRILDPPTAEHVAAVVRLLPTRYRLPVLVLDATGMRVGELEALTWGDIDEARGRWRIATSKTGRPRWVTPPAAIYERVLALIPRDDRRADAQVFDGVTGDRLRTRITRAATAAGVPMFSPHDLRHRRVSLLHLAGVPWARIGEAVGHDDITTTSRVYTHVLADETEVDYRAVLGRS